MNHLYTIALGILAWCADVEATDSQDAVTWIFPKGGEMFYYRDTVNVTYQSPYSSSPWMYVFCYEDSTVNSVSEIRWQEAEPYDGSMLIKLQFTSATSCWFNLRANHTGNAGSNSNQWTLADVERAGGPITTGAAGEVFTETATSAALTIDATATATTTSDSDSTSTSTSNSSSSSGFTSGAKIGVGIGIGFGLGTSLLCAGLFWWYQRHLKRKEHEQEVYRKVMRRNGSAASPGLGGFTKYPIDRVNKWRYQTQHPVAAVAESSYAMASVHRNDCHGSNPDSPSQFYCPTYDGHRGKASMAETSTTLPPSMPAQAAVTHNFQPSQVSIAHGLVSHSAAMQDAMATDYGDLGAGHAEASAAQQRIPSVNYGPRGRLDAGTGADFSLLPGYQSPMNRIPTDHLQYDDKYEARTPPTPPPPQSAYTRATPSLPPRVASSSKVAPSVSPSELPTRQTYRGCGPDAELPGDLQQPMLRHQWSNMHDAEQKFLVADIMPFRTTRDLFSTET